MVQTNALRSVLSPVVVAGLLLAGCSSGGATTATTSPPPTTQPTSTALPTTVPLATSTALATTTTTAPVKAEPITVSFPTKAGTVSALKLRNGAAASPVPAGATPFSVPFEGYEIRGVEFAGPEPAIVLMHGFPDNLHLYDEVFPLLVGKRRVIAFDFIGWGGSDKPLPGAFDYTMANNQAELGAVLDARSASAVQLVAHDASGIPGIDFALAEPRRVSRLVLLNTFYGLSPTQSPPYAINLYAAPGLQKVEQAVNLDAEALEQLYRYQLGLFLSGNPNATAAVDRLWSQFPEALPAFIALNDTLFDEVRQRTIGFGKIRELAMPVDIVFGGKDTNLTSTVANDLAGRIPGSTVTIVETASHFVQIDAPDVVAQHLLSA
jgi:haloalkane dehalogenase